MTKVTIKTNNAVRKMSNLERGTFFCHSGSAYVKTSRMVHEGTAVCSNALRLSDAESVFLHPHVEVETYNEAEVNLK